MMEHRRAYPVLAAVLLGLFSLAWLAAGAYQSHYQAGLRLLGDRDTTSLVGEPKDGRADEWSTYLPLLKQAEREGFPARSGLEPYRERFDWFITLPRADASLVLLPNQLAYWVLPAGAALSFQGLYYNLLLLLSVYWLLRNLRIAPWLASAAGVALLFSHLYQVWWTSNFPCLGASFLPFAVLTSQLRWRYRGPLLAWSIGHMLLGQLYPPFYFALAVAVLPFLAAARPDVLRPRNLAYAAIATAAACLVVLHFKLGFVEAVSGTTYPGLRFNTGGDSSPSTLLGVLFPTAPASASFDVGLAFYELSMAGTFFTLLGIAALPAVRWDAEAIRVASVSALVLLVLAVYMVAGFPEPLAKATGFFLAPGRRIQLGFSVLVLLLSVYLVSRAKRPLHPASLLAAFGAYALFSLVVGVRGDAIGQFAGIRWYPWLGFAILCVAGIASWLFARRAPAGRAMLVALVAGMSCVHVVAYGSFNPLMRAADILRPVDTQFVRDWKALHRMNGGKPLAVPGRYGNLLRGEQLAALQAIHLANTDDVVYAGVFPEMTAADRRRIFNQFVGIGFENAPGYRLAGVAATFDVRTHSVAFPHAVDRRVDGAPALNGAVRVGDVVRKDGTSYVVYWNAELSAPLAIDAPLVLHAACPVSGSWLTRYPTGGPLLAGGGTSLRGLAGQLTVDADDREKAVACARSLQVSRPDVRPLRAAQAIEDAAALRAGLAWSGRACELSGPARRRIEAVGPATLQGYVIAPSNRPPGAFDVLLAGERSYRVAATTGDPRPDVARYFGEPRLAATGFNIAVDPSTIAPGAYAVEFHGVEGGRGWFCESGKTIVVAP